MLGVCWILAVTKAFGQAPDKPGASADGSQKPSGGTNTTQVPAGFPVHSYDVRGNSLLPESRLKQIVDAYKGTNVGIPEILKAASDLQLEYQVRGFPTANVTLPPQKITNGTVQILVTEGLLAEITVKNNRYYSSDNVKRALPSLRTNIILNSHVFQAELDKANGNRDRQIYPQIVPGKETNTSALVLEVKDRIPLHGRLEYNNSATPNSPSDRINGTISYDNLWQLEHSIGFQYGFSPAMFKKESVSGLSMYPLDAPSVANYSLFYRAPISRERPISEELQQNPTAFGYNEATRRFVLPPASGRPEVSAYLSRSTTDLAIEPGRETVVNTALLRIDKEPYTRNVTKDESAGAGLLFRWRVWPGSDRW